MEHRNIQVLYECLLEQMGPQGWWPAESKPEIILGAILVQNTNWSNAEKSLINLKITTQFEPSKLKHLPTSRIEQLIRPSGFYKNKAQAIQTIFSWFEQYNWTYDWIKQEYGKDLREQLLTLHGIGPETADVLLVYVFDLPIFIADSYARRLFGYLNDRVYRNYDELRKEIKLPKSFTYQEAQEFHGLIDEFGKRYLKNKTDFENSFLGKF